MPKLNSLEVVHQDTNKDQFETLHDILVGLRNSLAVNREIVDGDARVAIENLLEMYVNDKEAFLRSLQTLTAQFKTSEAKYEEEILLQASALEALARRTTTITAQTENNLASVTEYAEAVASEVERKVSTYNQPEPPTENLTYGDLWFDTDNNNRLYWWNGLVWSESSDTYNLNDFINTTYASDYAAIEAQVDSKAETWFQTADPSTAWTTQEIRDLHDKDLWYSTSTKLLKIYTASTNTWTIVQDQAAIDAATAASAAQETADGKIVTFVQSTAPTAEGIGDLWMDTANNRQMKRWNGSSWVSVDDTRIAQTYSRWGVQVNANGNVAGIQLNSDSTGTSEFSVLASAFKVYNTSSGTNDAIFVVQNGQVTPRNLQLRDSSGNYILSANNFSSNVTMWKPLLQMGTASNLGNPALPAFKGSSYANEGIFGEGVANTSTCHGVRGKNAVVGTSGLVGVQNGYDFYADGSGTNYGPFTGAHDALVPKDDVYEIGDIVVDKTCIVKKNLSNTLFEVEKSSTINQKGVVGVLANNNGLLKDNYPPSSFGFNDVQSDEDGNLVLSPNAEYDAVKDTYNYVTMNAIGEGQVNVCGENGNISKGDLIVSSSIPGKGMKQADDIIRSYTVAKAREDVTFSSPTEIKQVACIYLCG